VFPVGSNTHLLFIAFNGFVGVTLTNDIASSFFTVIHHLATTLYGTTLHK
jgi:hypothetical protein